MRQGNLFFLVRAISLSLQLPPSGPVCQLRLALPFLMLFRALLLRPQAPILPPTTWSSFQGCRSPPLPDPSVLGGPATGWGENGAGPADPGLQGLPARGVVPGLPVPVPSHSLPQAAGRST